MKGVYELLGLIYRYGGFDAYRAAKDLKAKNGGEPLGPSAAVSCCNR